ncbi:amino acid transporter [Patellaria atrata CBS 101060]|uniref:Amino acid transporter n=1 Tax=Patellaria atrata CBS 101060 TaxID=1346257 RepID=A0A9P4SF60_9PEZI|nr:amino acid transporter [Patellaria atrata CBS 101060]
MEKNNAHTPIGIAQAGNQSNTQLGEPNVSSRTLYTRDEYHLATLGYRQVFFRKLGLFENWAATFAGMNFVSGIPVLFAFAMYTAGPAAAFSNWTMVGGLACFVAFAMAEIAAALPTAGGIYYWSYRLGGPRWGPFLSWMTAWWNWAGWVTIVPGVQQGATNFLISALEIKYPNADVLKKGWFVWILTSLGMVLTMVPNIQSQRAIFQTTANVFDQTYNGINLGEEKQASDAYSWVISVLFGAWCFYGFDASVHLAEETQDASEVVAKGMWMSTVSAWLLSVPTLIMILFCMQDFEGIINAHYTNNWAEYLIQLVGEDGAVALLVMLWIDSTCAAATTFMSAQRVTYAISRDNVLPGSKYFKIVSQKNHMPINAAFLVFGISVIICTAVIGSTVAFSAITATATIATNFSYLFPIVARHTVGKKRFKPAKWNLGRASPYIAAIASMWICFQVGVLLLPQLYPVTGKTLNYAPVMIGGVTLISVVGWWLPFEKGGRYWFKGPQRTISKEEVENGRMMDEDED